MAYPADPLGIRIEFAIGADLAADPGTWSWTDVTSSWYVPAGIFDKLGRTGESAATESMAGFTLRNPDGEWSIDNPVAAAYPYFTEGLPVRYSLDIGGGFVQQFLLFVSSIEATWDRSAALPLTRVEARGRLWTTARRGDVARSALTRTILAADPSLYWPMQDASGAPVVASGLPEGAPLYPSGTVTMGGTTLLPPGGSAAVAIGDDGRVSGPTGYASGADAGADGWEAEICVGWDALDHGLVNVPILGFNMPPGHAFRQVGIAVIWDSPSYYLGHYDFDGTTTGYSHSTTLGPIVGGRVYHYRIRYVQNGANVDRGRFRDGVTNGSGSFAGTNYYPVSLTFNPRFSAGQPDSASHLALWSPVRATPATYLAVDGFTGEQAHERIERLCTEASIPFTSAATVSTAMGPQPAGTTESLMREAEATDHGIVDDSQGGVTYFALDELVNQATVITLDGGARELGRPFSQRRDGSTAANDVTVTNPRAVTARYADVAHQARTGAVLPATLAVNPEADSELASHGAWLASVRNAPEGRLPAMLINFGQREVAEAHAAAWLAAGPRPGLRLDITNPPAGSYPREPRLIIQGRTQTVRGPTQGWTVVADVAPAAPYDAAEFADTPGNETTEDGHYDTDGCELGASLTSGQTTAIVRTSTGGPHWTYDSADRPFYLAVGGEDVEVTGVDPLGTDGFSGVSASGWGAADSGQAWTIDGGVAGDYTKDGTDAIMTLASTASRRSAHLAGVDEPYQDVETVITGVAALTQPWRASIILRRVDSSNYYLVHLNVGADQVLEIYITRRLAGVETNIAQGVTVTRTPHVSGNPIWLRAQIFGTTIRARAWADSAEEPSFWHAQATDASHTSGSTGLAAIRLTGNTNAALEVKFGSFVTLNPQVLTIARSVNGVAKSHSVGAAVALAERSARRILP